MGARKIIHFLAVLTIVHISACFGIPKEENQLSAEDVSNSKTNLTDANNTGIENQLQFNVGGSVKNEYGPPINEPQSSKKSFCPNVTLSCNCGKNKDENQDQDKAIVDVKHNNTACPTSTKFPRLLTRGYLETKSLAQAIQSLKQYPRGRSHGQKIVFIRCSGCSNILSKRVDSYNLAWSKTHLPEASIKIGETLNLVCRNMSPQRASVQWVGPKGEIIGTDSENPWSLLGILRLSRTEGFDIRGTYTCQAPQFLGHPGSKYSVQIIYE